MMALLEEGSGDMTAQDFAAAKERLQPHSAMNPIKMRVDFCAVSHRKPRRGARLRQSLLTPNFDIDAVERVRAQVLTGLNQRN